MMAGADYKSCDVCGGKTFYDAEMNYQGLEDEWNKNQPWAKEVGKELGEYERYKLGYLGDWAVLCDECAKTHKTQIVKLDL